LILSFNSLSLNTLACLRGSFIFISVVTAGPAPPISFSLGGDPLSYVLSESADLFFVSTGEETEEELRLLLDGSYRSNDRRRFRSLPPRLLLLDGLRRRRRGGVTFLLLLRVSRRSLRVVVRVSISSTGVCDISILSSLRETLRMGVRPADRDRDVEGDLDLEVE